MYSRPLVYGEMNPTNDFSRPPNCEYPGCRMLAGYETQESTMSPASNRCDDHRDERLPQRRGGGKR